MKTQKTGFIKMLSNNIFMLKLAFRACPSRVVGNFMSVLLRYGILLMYLNVVFFEKIVRFIESGAPFRQAFGFLIFSVVFLGAGYTFCTYYDKKIAPAGNQILYEKLHLRMFEKATDVELECFENPEFYNKYTKATSQIKGKVFSVLTTLSDLGCILFNISFLTYKAVRTDGFVLAFIFFPIIGTYVIGVKTNKLRYQRYEANVKHERTKEYVKRTVYLQDYAKEIRLSNIFPVLMDYFHEAIRETIRNIQKYGRRMVFLHGLQSAFHYSLTIGGTILYAALRLLYWKDITAADFVVLINIISSFIWNVMDVSRNFAKMQDHSQYIENIKSFMEYEPKISESQQGLTPKRRAALSVKNVSYTYLGQKEPVLKNINMEIRPGEKIALVGHNGAGKTTLVKLLMRLYDTTEGDITLDDINIKEYCVKSYRSLFGTVFQDYQMFSLSVAENVMMGDVKEEDRQRVVEALENSGVYEQISALKHGIDTTMTKEFDRDGVVLSGGQAQKIAIARVFARDCDFVILDEPSSALDPIAEHEMYDRMLAASADRAVIFISHRLSSAVLADRIYLLEKGQIVETGSHRELMEKNGKYAEMFRMQAENYVRR